MVLGEFTPLIRLLFRFDVSPMRRSVGPGAVGDGVSGWQPIGEWKQERGIDKLEVSRKKKKLK